MRFFLLPLMGASLVAGFVPAVHKATTTTTQLEMERREVILTGIMALAAPAVANAAGPTASSTYFFDDSQVNEPSQQSTDGKLDLNAAFVGDYKILRGMFPHAAGKIASNGPYDSVSDIYKIPGLTESDKKLFKKYEKTFTVNPPGRAFDERINNRVST